MSLRMNVQHWIVAALKSHGGSASLIEVARYMWTNYRADIDSSPNLLYTWQYEVRWSASELRKLGVMKSAALSPRKMCLLVAA